MAKNNMLEKREFGFIVEQAVDEQTQQAENEQSINRFFNEIKSVISETWHIEKDTIETELTSNHCKEWIPELRKKKNFD